MGSPIPTLTFETFKPNSNIATILTFHCLMSCCPIDICDTKFCYCNLKTKVDVYCSMFYQLFKLFLKIMRTKRCGFKTIFFTNFFECSVLNL